MRASAFALSWLLCASSAAAQTSDIRLLARASARDLIARASQEERSGQPLRAESLFLRALEVDRGEADAWLGAARLLDARGRRDEALRLLRSIPRHALQRAESRVEVARALHAAGEGEAAIALLRDDASGSTLRARVTLCAAIGRFPEALAAARLWSELPDASEAERREATVTARALARLVAEADAVRYAPEAPALRRLLQRR